MRTIAPLAGDPDGRDDPGIDMTDMNQPGNNHHGNTGLLDHDSEPSWNGEVDDSVDDGAEHASVSNKPEPDASQEVSLDDPSTGFETAPAGPVGPSGLELADEAVESAVAAVPAPDASLAEYGSEEDIERALESMTAEVVIGRDDRVRINATASYPWRAICSLRIKAEDGTNWIGTGFLVGPRVVVTAGHVVFMRNHGGWADEIEVIPGRNGTARPYGSCKSSHLHSVAGWTNNKQRDFDYGAIILPNECRYGERVGWFGYANFGSSTLRDLTVNLSGYPGDKGGSTQWWHARRITKVSSKRLRYNIDTAGGQSGAPVWRLRNGQRHVIGIHTSGSTSGNGATRINRAVYDRIKSWKKLHR